MQTEEYVRQKIKDAFVSSNMAKCDKCENIKRDIFKIITNRHAQTAEVLCSDCFEDLQWANVTDWDEDEGSFMGA